MKKRILVVDDEKRIRDNYCRLFSSVGSTLFEVVEAKDALEAAEILAREPIDVVLLDLRMPGVGGEKLFNVIQETNPRIHVIVASVYPIEKQKKIVPQADDYYDKSQGLLGLLEKTTNTLVV